MSRRSAVTAACSLQAHGQAMAQHPLHHPVPTLLPMSVRVRVLVLVLALGPAPELVSGPRLVGLHWPTGQVPPVLVVALPRGLTRQPQAFALGRQPQAFALGRQRQAFALGRQRRVRVQGRRERRGAVAGDHPAYGPRAAPPPLVWRGTQPLSACSATTSLLSRTRWRGVCLPCRVARRGHAPATLHAVCTTARASWCRHRLTRLRTSGHSCHTWPQL